MTTPWKDVARACLAGAESGAMTFPQIVGALIEAGFDGYAVDLRRATAIYYRPDGESLELATTPTTTPVAERFDAAAVKAAIVEAQALVPGYTYKGLLRQSGRGGLCRLSRLVRRQTRALSRSYRRDAHRALSLGP